MVFLPYASQIIVSYGINDVAHGSAYDGIRAIQSIWRAAGAQKKYCITIEPYTTSVSKNWTVAPGDQVNAAKNRIAFNNLVRSGIPGGTGYYEIADVVESSRDSGLWAGASPPNTLDGLHPSESGYALIASSGAVRLG